MTNEEVALTIEDFLEHNVTGYLFSDLDSLAEVEPPKDKHAGGASYPMLISILSGIELLGALVNPSGSVEKSGEINGNKQFVHFWSWHLSEHDKKYKGLENLFYDLLRNGLAHTFVVKQGVEVYKSHPHHLRLEDSKLIVGCVQFAEDLKATYSGRVEPALSGNKELGFDREKMQTNLNDLLKAYNTDSIRHFAGAKPSRELKKMQWPDSDLRISGPSILTVKSSELEPFTTPSGILPPKKYRKW